MNKFFKFYLIAFISIYSAFCSAIETSISNVSSKGSNTYFDYSLDSWSVQDNSPNPCKGVGICYLYLMPYRGMLNPATVELRDLSYRDDKNILKVKTIGDLGKLWRKKYPVPDSGNDYMSGSSDGSECVGMFYSYIDGYNYLKPLGIGNCKRVPAPAVCSILNSNIIIDHKSLKPGSESEASSSVTLVCNKSSKVSLKLVVDNNGAIEMVGTTKGLKTTLFINDNPSQTSFVTTVGPYGNTVSIKSKVIIPLNIESGIYLGSTTLVLSVL